MSLPDGAADELVSEVRSVVENNQRRNDEVDVSGRVCESDKNNGVQVTLKGPHVRLRPVIEFFADEAEWKLENVNMVPDADKGKCPSCEEELFQNSISVFCAYVGEEQDEAALSDVFV